MTTSKTTKTAHRSSELAAADHSAITVKSEPVAPIANDVSSAWDAFSSRPTIAATGSALKSAASGIELIWAHEKEFATGQNFFRFLYDASKAVLGPLFALLWSASNSLYVWTRKPETRAQVAAKWQSLKTWAAPKFAYKTEADRESALKL